MECLNIRTSSVPWITNLVRHSATKPRLCGDPMYFIYFFFFGVDWGELSGDPFHFFAQFSLSRNCVATKLPPQRNCFFIAYEPANANASSSLSSSGNECTKHEANITRAAKFRYDIIPCQIPSKPETETTRTNSHNILNAAEC